MANTTREEGQVSIGVESAWGTGVTTNLMQLEVEPAEWLTDMMEEWRDNLVRNVLAVDVNAIPTVGHSEGSLKGMFTPIMAGYLLDAFLGGTETKGNLMQSNGTTDTTLDAHDLTVGRDPRSLTIQQHDALTDELFIGSMVQTLTLRSKTGESILEWEADFIGSGAIRPATPRTVVENTMIVAKPPKPFVGAQLSTNITSPGGSTDGAVARILDFEMVLSRTVEVEYGASNTKRPNIRRTSPPEITFTATTEFQSFGTDALDITKYINDVGTGSPVGDFNESTATYWDSNFDTWHIRWATDPDITITMTPLPTTAIAAGIVSGLVGEQFGTTPTTDQGMLDIYFDRVSYAEAPLRLDHSQRTATFQFKGRALYDFTDSRLAIFRLVNKKTSTYVTNDV